jgi:hypothetical protein
MIANKQRRSSSTHIAGAIARKLEIKQKKFCSGRRATLLDAVQTPSQGAKTNVQTNPSRPKGARIEDPLYLAFLIGRAKSTCYYAFFRLSKISSAAFSLLRSRAAFANRAGAICIHQAGSMRSFAFSTGLSHALHQVRKQGCPSSRALSSHGRQQARDSGHSPFRGPARGRSPRARISNLRSSSTRWVQSQRQFFSQVPHINAPASTSVVASPWRRGQRGSRFR